MFGVWLNSAVVPAMGYAALYNILGAMACLSMILNYKLEYTFETVMPFVTRPKAVETEATETENQKEAHPASEQKTPNAE